MSPTFTATYQVSNRQGRGVQRDHKRMALFSPLKQPLLPLQLRLMRDMWLEERSLDAENTEWSRCEVSIRYLAGFLRVDSLRRNCSSQSRQTSAIGRVLTARYFVT